MTEHDLQRCVAEFLDRALPPDAWWTSIDSAGRGAIAGARMKRRGVKRGLPDILVFAGSTPHLPKTLWIELKSKAGRLTQEQQTFRQMADRAGHSHAICRSVWEVQNVLEYLDIPLRARVSA